jgi:hypothetical protein
MTAEMLGKSPIPPAMTRLYLKAALLFWMGITLMTLFVLARPSEQDSGLRALVMPDGCPMPCFMGIRPGVTTAEEATQILKDSGWVSNLATPPQAASRVVNELIWQWNTSFPYLPEAILPYGNFVIFRDDIVDTILAGTSLSLADYNHLWDKPDHYLVEVLPQAALLYAYEYPEQQVRVMGLMACPYFPSVWWNATNIVLGSGRESFQTPRDRPDDGLFLKKLVQFGYQSCGR